MNADKRVIFLGNSSTILRTQPIINNHQCRLLRTSKFICVHLCSSVVKIKNCTTLLQSAVTLKICDRFRKYGLISDKMFAIGVLKTKLIPMDRAVIKFSSEDCGICHKMSFYDQKVTEELGLKFIDVKMQDTATYRKYRKILLTQYPDKAEMGWPTYILCDSPEAEFKILGEVKGGHPKGEFRTKLQAVLDAAT